MEISLFVYFLFKEHLFGIVKTEIRIEDTIILKGLILRYVNPYIGPDKETF